MLRTALIAALAAVPWGSPHGPAWMKLEQARTASALTGRPVCIYVAVDPKTGDFT